MGCEHLSKADWDKLQQLDLGNLYLIEGNNKICAVGCEHLAKAKWSSLQRLNLGNNKLIEE